MFEFVRNFLIPDHLILHDQIYKHVKNDGRTTHWQCFKLDCNATCQTRDGKVIVRMGLHGHPVPREMLKKRARQNRIIKRKL